MAMLFGGKSPCKGHNAQRWHFLLQIKSRFGLENRDNAFYLCGPQSLLGIFASAASFDLHCDPTKLAE